MKNLTLRFLSLAILTCLLSCSKNKDNNPPSTPNANTLSNVSGILYSEYFIIDSTVFMPAVQGQDAMGDFFTSPGAFNSTTLPAGVSVNDMPLEIDGDSVGYFGSDIDMTGNCSWNITGNSIIPSFSFNFPEAYPTVIGSVPDSIDKSQGVTFNFTFGGADSVFIVVGSDAMGQPIGKGFPSSSVSQSFTASELANIYTSTSIGYETYVMVYAHNYTVQNFGGKDFAFVKTLFHTYTSWTH
jgi:hypothetical protein